MAGAAVLGVIISIVIVVPLVVSFDLYQQNLADSLLPPGSVGHPLGTDHLGRDVLQRLIDGGRISLSMGVIAVTISVALGGAIGLLAGFFGGRLDLILMRLIDVKLAFPGILLALVIVTILGSGLDKAMIAVGIGGLPRYARVVRSQVLGLKNQQFVEAAASLGASDWRVMLRHVLPHTLGPIVTLATLGLGTTLLATAGLSFLGLGAQPPTAEWGLMLTEARKYLRVAWWLAVLPGVAIMTTVLSINLLGDGVRDALDPGLQLKSD
jgi:peptide/nickel transport system permease protein